MGTGVVVAEAGVGDRVGVRQGLGRHVVVGNHHREAQFPGPRHGAHVADAAVHGEQDARFLFGGKAFDLGDVEPVTFLAPVREVDARGYVVKAQRLQDQRGPGDAVHVVVAPDEHAAALSDAFFKRVHGLCHARPAVGGGEVAQAGGKEGVHVGHRLKPAPPEQIGYNLWDAELVRPVGGAGAVFLRGAEFPNFHRNGVSLRMVRLEREGETFWRTFPLPPSSLPILFKDV